MRYSKSCVRLAVFLVFPAFASASPITVSNHSSYCNGCGLTQYYHADLNNDGREDLVWPFEPYMGVNGSFLVQLSNGDGTYAAPVSYKIPGYQGDDVIAATVLGDFNHDGNIDIAQFSYDSGNLYLYLNDGKGGFTLGGTIAYGAAGGSAAATSAVVGDFNHDNLSDLAFVQNGRLNIWFGNGKAGFTPGPSMGVNGDIISLGDFDGDGKADLLMKDSAINNVATVLYGDGTGHFPQATSVTATVPAGSTGTDYVNFSAGDVNSDGASDIMATHNQITNDRIFVFYGDSTRKFLKQASPRIGRCIGGPAQTADMDGNGINDLIVDETDCANPSVGVQFVDVLTRNPNSSYNPDQTVYWAQPVNGVVYPIQMPPLVVRANLDSKPDLVTVQCADDHCFSQYTTTQLNTTVGNFPTCSAPVATGINVCSPPAGTPVASPVSFAVGASGTVPMRDVEVWIDGAKRAEQIDGFSRYTFLNSSVTLNPGTHSVTVFGAGWDQSLVSKSFTVSVQ